MKPKQIMLIAGEPSGDLLASELVGALRKELTAAETQYTTDSQPLRTGLEPHFFGAGGPHMAAAGVELAFDLTEHSIIGIPSPMEYLQYRKDFKQLMQIALAKQPDVIVGIDYNYFNLHFAQMIRQYTTDHSGWFHDWRPKLVKYISPQLWASRGGRADQMARDFDLVLSIFPFEKDWYAKRVPGLSVEFVGHPMVERYSRPLIDNRQSTVAGKSPQILLLPGSRKGELRRHLPVMLGALRLIRKKFPGAVAKMVLPNEKLEQQAKKICPASEVEVSIGGLVSALAETDAAISKTGTISTECAFFGVPTVTLYKASWATYEVGKRIVKVKSLTMPNLLANEEVFPEFIQNAATSENIANATLELLQNESRRKSMKAKLAEVIASLGGPGASQRAARAITHLLVSRTDTNGRGSQRKLLTSSH